MTKMLKTQKTQIIVDETTVIHRIAKSGILDGLERVMLRTCVHHMAASLFSPFYFTYTSFLLNMPLPCIISMLTMLYSPHCIHMVFTYINYIRKNPKSLFCTMDRKYSTMGALWHITIHNGDNGPNNIKFVI